jgi:maltooligosyltrehalose trehalohydrolase
MADRFRHRLPFGAETGPEGSLRFRIWAPDCRELRLSGAGGVDLPMRREAGGWFEVETGALEPGDAYAYRLPDGRKVPDPAARAQSVDVHGASLVVDPRSFRWRNPDWNGRPWETAVISEVHVGTATPEGTFDALGRRLDHFAETGIAAIELMPVAQFSGRRGWGYDGVLLFAPHNAYGTPDDLKRLIDEAHGAGLMVLLDVVYNHFGPDGNYLPSYASRFFDEARHTPWGAAIDFGERAVRASLRLLANLSEAEKAYSPVRTGSVLWPVPPADPTAPLQPWSVTYSVTDER